jgi:pimeloyl-ACP methyl ester carboxylesterase
VDALLELLEEAEEDADLDRINLLEAWMWLDGPGSEEGRVGGAVRDLFLTMNGANLYAPDPGRETNQAAFPAAYTRLKDLTLPVQVVWGDGDFAHLQQRCVHLVQAMPQAVSAVIPDTAHLPNLEQPEVFNQHLKAFLDRL